MDKKYVLVLLGAESNGEKNGIDGQSWIQKIMYAASKAHPRLECGFEPPSARHVYSRHLKNILRSMEADGLVRMEKGGEERQPIRLTRRGRQDVNKAIKDVGPNVFGSPYSPKSVFNGLNYREMIILSYAKFPEMLEKSELEDDYKKWRKCTAPYMVRHNKISMSLGAHTYGTEVADFENLLAA